MFLVFGKCLFLSRWKNTLSVSLPLHLRFCRNKSVTLMVISFIGRLLCGIYPVKVRFSSYICGIHAAIAWLLCPTYRSREPRVAEEINFVTG